MLIRPLDQLNIKDYITITFSDFNGTGVEHGIQARRLTRDNLDNVAKTTNIATHLYMVVAATGSETNRHAIKLVGWGSTRYIVGSLR